MRMALRFGEPFRHLPNGAAKLFHVEKLGSPKSRHQSGGTLRELGASMTEAAMSRWTDEELRELITLWPPHSVSQIVERLHRPRWAIRSKAKRLHLDGLSPHNPSEGVDVGNPPKRRPLKAGSYCRSGVRSRLPRGVGRHRVEANGRALSQRAIEDVAQVEEPGSRIEQVRSPLAISRRH